MKTKTDAVQTLMPIFIILMLTLQANAYKDSSGGSVNVKMCSSSRKENDLLDESVYLMKPYQDKIGRPAESSGLTYDISDSKSKSCPMSVGSYSMMSCPSYLVVNFDPLRRPKTVVEAKCACASCMNSNSVLNCMPIFYYRAVLEVPTKYRRRQQSDQCFKRVTRAFKVGCECGGGWRTNTQRHRAPP